MTDTVSAVTDYAVVVPTVARSSLRTTLACLAAQEYPPSEVVIVDDRPDPPVPLSAPSALTSRIRTRVVRGGARGPAAARNLGWQLTDSPWVVFVDDDVELPSGWSALLVRDLRAATARTGGIQATVAVPLPRRRPTDWERNTAALAGARWITAEMAFRRESLSAVAGFDERFTRAYREDADLALRLQRAGWHLWQSDRTVIHPVRPADPWVSVRAQRGNADDALMRTLHGRSWRTAAGAGRGRLRAHLATVTLGALAIGGAAFGSQRWGRRLALAGSVGWAAMTADFAVRRVLPGPRTPKEIACMAATSAVIPWTAIGHHVRGRLRHRGAAPWPLPPVAVLFDRDGTLIQNEERPEDPSDVRPLPGAADAVAKLRECGIAVGVVTNQSAVGEGHIGLDAVLTRNFAVDKEIGPFDTWQTCPHRASDGCNCRKPAPGMVRAAAASLGVSPLQCVVVGDTVSDLLAARHAGACDLLVPNAETQRSEVANAPRVAPDLTAAVKWVLKEARR